MASCALWSLEEATIFMADVIFSVLFIEFVLPFTSSSDAMMLIVYTVKPLRPLLFR